MSSILTALKKVRRDTPPAVVFQARSRALDLNHAINAGLYKRLRRRRGIIVGLAVAAVSIGLWAVYAHHQRLLALAPLGLRQALGPAQSLSPASEVHPDQNKTGLAAAPVAKKQHQVVKQATRKASLPLLSKVAPPKAVIPLASEAVNLAARQPKPNFKKPTPRKRPSSPVVAPMPNNLKLQAIAWNAQAAKRLAVIDNRMVHEGEFIGGLRVETIKAKSVVVTDGPRKWTLHFAFEP